MLVESNSWSVRGIRTAAEFFRNVSLLVPDATHLFLEGSPDPDVAALLTAATAEMPYAAPAGTIWSWPRKNRRFSVRASAALFARLSDAALHHAEPEVCDHLHLYRGPEVLVQWFDAFLDPLLVSKAIERARVERFAAAVGGTLQGD